MKRLRKGSNRLVLCCFIPVKGTDIVRTIKNLKGNSVTGPDKLKPRFSETNKHPQSKPLRYL